MLGSGFLLFSLFFGYLDHFVPKVFHYQTIRKIEKVKKSKIRFVSIFCTVMTVYQSPVSHHSVKGPKKWVKGC